MNMPVQCKLKFVLNKLLAMMIACLVSIMGTTAFAGIMVAGSPPHQCTMLKADSVTGALPEKAELPQAIEGCVTLLEKDPDNKVLQMQLANANYVAKQYQVALGLIEPLAKAGHSEAQYRLGEMYLTGRGVEYNVDRAGHWFGLGATQKYIPAMFDIAVMKEHGVGPGKDLIGAGQLYYQAAQAGHEEAQNLLDALITGKLITLAQAKKP